MVLLKNFIFIILLLITSISYAKHVKILVVAIHGIETAKLEWQPTVDHLQSSMPQHSFSLIPLPPNDLAKIKNLIAKNEIDFVISQPAIYVDLEINFGVSRILTMVKKGGLSEFGSIIITRADSEVNTIDDLKGKTIAGAAKLGFGGWLIGYKEMLNHGFEPYTDAKKVIFLGTQPTEVNAVLEHNVDAAVIRTGVLEKLSKNGEVNLADFKILSPKKYTDFPLQVSTSLYPEWAFAKTTKVSNELSKSVAFSLLSIKGDSETAQKAGYLEWTFPYDYQPVHELLKELQVGPYKHYGKITTIDFIIQHKAEFIIFLILIVMILVMSITIYHSNLILSKGKLEKEKLLENIKKSQNQYKEAQQLAKLGHWGLDLETNKLHWSDEIYRIFEINPEEFEVTYEGFVNIIHPDDREFVNKAYTDSINNRIDYDIEHRLLMKNGQIKYVHERCETDYDDNGKPLKSMGTVLDITDRKLTELALQESNDKFQALTETTQDFVWEVTADGIYTYCSPQTIGILGYRPEELLGKRPMDIMSKEEAERVGNFFKNAVAQQASIKEFENFNLTKDGREVILETSAQPFFSITGELLGYRGIDRDITKRKQAEKTTQEQARLLDLIFQHSLDSIVLLDKDYNFIRVSETYAKACQKDSSEFPGHNHFEFYPSNFKDEVDEAKKGKYIYQKSARPFINSEHPEWGTTYLDLGLVPIFDETGEIEFFLFTLKDVTEHKRDEELIKHQATFDALTNLPNRFLALDRLSQLINKARRDAKRVAVLFLDLDDFKKINDTLGHDIGDKLLIEAAERLRSGLRNGDTVGRLGGDEFIILLGGLDDAADARPIAENLLNHFRAPFIIENRELILTSSVGIAVYPDDGDSSSQLLRNADSAMYHSKKLGRNTYSYFTEAMNQEVSRRLALEEQMHGALERGEFRLCYQPKVDITNRRISGVEALLRWNNPVLGDVSPDEFIVIAEQTGQIVPIGQFVLIEALTMAVRWQSKVKQSFTMAVNLSPRQFREPNLVAFIEQAIEKSGISSENLELEITEGVLISGYAYIEDALANLSDLGVSIAMDDFGTGYSSLSYLRSYPFNVLKIDRSFINDITVNPADRELVNAAIAMAHSLGLKVVAEGVETEEQLAHLATQGCELAQGYLFSKPVTAEEITKMIEEE